MHPVLALHTLLRFHSPAMLCLHSVGDGRDALPASIFRGLLEVLKERKYRFLTADDLTHVRILRSRNVLLTFDDGRQDNLSVVLPILQEYGIQATFYICSGLAGRRVVFPAHPDRAGGGDEFGLIDWPGLRRMRDAGMCIGSHGAMHRELTRCSDEELVSETHGSRAVIEQNLGIPVRHFAYPWGRFDSRVLQSVRAAGYQTAAAVSVNPSMPIRPWDGFTLSRVTVHPAAGKAQLLQLIGFRNLVRRAASQTRRWVLASSGAAS